MVRDIIWTNDWVKDGPFAGALVEGDRKRIFDVNRRVADLPGPLVPVQFACLDEIGQAMLPYCLNWLIDEISTSINTAAAGGNASLMAIG